VPRGDHDHRWLHEVSGCVAVNQLFLGSAKLLMLSSKIEHAQNFEIGSIEKVQVQLVHVRRCHIVQLSHSIVQHLCVSEKPRLSSLLQYSRVGSPPFFTNSAPLRENKILIIVKK
jgi:hypothetical protein